MNTIKRLILRKLFKQEMLALLQAFEQVASASDKTKLHKDNRRKMDKSISNFREAFIRIYEK